MRVRIKKIEDINPDYICCDVQESLICKGSGEIVDVGTEAYSGFYKCLGCGKIDLLQFFHSQDRYVAVRIVDIEEGS